MYFAFKIQDIFINCSVDKVYLVGGKRRNKVKTHSNRRSRDTKSIGIQRNCCKGRFEISFKLSE